MDRFDIRLAGLGGQGLLLAGLILGDAAAVHDGLNAVQTINYAPLARGAPSRAEIAISRGPIYFPEVEEANVLLAMSQDAYDSFKDEIKPDGVVIVNSTDVQGASGENILSIPIARLAHLSTGKAITGSIVGLGIICRLTGLISEEALGKSVRQRAPRGTVDLNIRALKEGLDAEIPEKFKNRFKL